MAAEKFRKEGVGVSLTVTPCWCYGSETMDMDPGIPEGRVGFQWHRAARRSVSGGGQRRAQRRRGCPPSPFMAGTCRTAATRRFPTMCGRRSCAFVQRRPGRRDDARQILPLRRRRLDGHRRSIVNPDLFEDYLGMRVECVDMTELARRIEENIFDAEEFEARPRLGAAALSGRCKDYNQAEALAQAEGLGVGVLREVRDDRARPDGRQSAPGDARLRRGGARAQRHRSPASRASASGPTTIRTATSSRRCSVRPSTGTASASRTWWRPRTTSLNGACMLFGHLLTDTAQIFADVRTYWSPAAVKRVTGPGADRRGGAGPAAPDQLRGGGAGWMRASSGGTASRR